MYRRLVRQRVSARPALPLPPIRDVPEEVDTLKLDQIEVKSYVGALVNSFERNAA